MSKLHTQYICQECGRATIQPMGRCPTCGAWDSMVEEVVADEKESKGSPQRFYSPQSIPVKLSEVDEATEERWPLSMSEFARVLGGGMVPGSIVLLGGDPGIGKSTLMLQVALEMAGRGTVLYVSGEESARQIRMRARRLMNGEAPLAAAFPDGLMLVTETNLEAILAHVESVKPALLVVDSIQTVFLDALSSSAGSVSQVRECAGRLRELAKSTGITVFLIGHVTKEGAIAGPRVLEHIVDTVLQLEGDRFQSYRLLRSMKNRFGPTAEVGVFVNARTGDGGGEQPLRGLPG